MSAQDILHEIMQMAMDYTRPGYQISAHFIGYIGTFAVSITRDDETDWLTSFAGDAFDAETMRRIKADLFTHHEQFRHKQAA